MQFFRVNFCRLRLINLIISILDESFNLLFYILIRVSFNGTSIYLTQESFSYCFKGYHKQKITVIDSHFLVSYFVPMLKLLFEESRYFIVLLIHSITQFPKNFIESHLVILIGVHDITEFCQFRKHVVNLFSLSFLKRALNLP